MKKLIGTAVALALAACGGQETSPAPTFIAEHAVAEIRDGTPYCEPRKTGTGLLPLTPDPRTPEVTAAAECRWSCAELFGFDREAVTVYFYETAGAWHMSVTRNGDGYDCP